MTMTAAVDPRATVVHRYQPFGTCIDLFKCRAPEVLFAGPAGTGKSRACLEKLHAIAMANPGMRGLMLRKTLQSLKSSGLVTYREHVAQEHIASGEVKYYGGSAQEVACYKYKNGSVIVIGGMDDPLKVMSTEYDIVYVQEANQLAEEDWNKITTRLRNGKVSFQQLMADCNPDVPQHWLKVRCDEGRTTMIESRHEDNPVYFNQVPVTDEVTGTVTFVAGELTPRGKQYIEGILDNLQGVEYQRLRLGKWAAAEGLIYDGYSPTFSGHHHVGRPPKGWKLWLSIDFGYTNPFVCQFWAEDNDGRLYLIKEIYKTRELVENHAKDIKAILRRMKNPRVTGVICDHDAEDRATLTKHLGYATIPAKKSVSDGIQAVASRLKDAGDGKPRLYLCADATYELDHGLKGEAKPTSTAQEILGYVWDIKDGKPPKEVPVKENDHGMDAMRYMVAHRDLRKKSRVRAFNL